MTRIIAGAARGRRLAVPPKGTRPTSDRVREAMFSSIDSDLRSRQLMWSGVRVLDLFAGTGALGLEALSRGAAQALMVERSREAARVLKANVAVVGSERATVLIDDVLGLRALPAPEGGMNLCFADPPYEWPATDIADLLTGLDAAGWLAPEALVIVERPAKDPSSPLPAVWADTRRRPYGDTALWYGHTATSEQ